jgi:hypothetical protein
LVGLQYHLVPIDVYEAVSKDFITLKQDKNNKHDVNAIEVMIKGYKVGFIDKASASVIAPLLDKNYSHQVTPYPVNRNKKSIKLSISFYIPDFKATLKPDLESLSGIYQISVSANQYLYIGQSENIKKRISAHWDALQFNSHANKRLQSLWNELGNGSFKASIVETVPNSVSSELERQRWLGEREQHWIRHARKTSDCVNVTDGEIVTTKVALQEYQEEERRFNQEHDEWTKKRKEELKIEIYAADIAYRTQQKEFDLLNNKIQPIETFIKRHTGFFANLFGDPNRQKAQAMLPEYNQLSIDLKRCKEKKA